MDDVRQDDLTAVEGKPTLRLSKVEGARVLANEAREDMESRGFDDAEIIEMAERYVKSEEGVALDAFLRWVDAQTR